MTLKRKQKELRFDAGEWDIVFKKTPVAYIIIYGFKTNTPKIRVL